MRAISTVLLAIVATTLVATASAQPASAKPAWQWTLDERLAVRHDPAAAAARLREERGGSPARAKTNAALDASSPDRSDIINGTKHPELILPWELFDDVMKMAYADDPQVRSFSREAKEKQVIALGLSAEFWTRLEILAAPYLSDSRQIRDLHKGHVTDPAVKRRIVVETNALENLKCRDRAAAIAAARREFGEKFDRFLYEGVAPNMSIGVGPAGHISALRMHEIEEGCP